MIRTRSAVAIAALLLAGTAHAQQQTPAPSELELTTLRDLQARTKAAHEGTAKEKAA